jgi:hypothetical protein
MSNEDKREPILQYKILYSLSFILVLWGLKDFILSWFPNNFSINLFSKAFSVNQIFGLMVLILFVSLYLYGVNYIISNPLNKFRKIINYLASAFWFIFFIFPLLILLLILLKEIFMNVGVFVIILSIVSSIGGFFMAFISQKITKRNDLLIFDKQIENLKLMKVENGMSAEFLKQYLLLELVVKKLLVLKLGVNLGYDKSINVFGISKYLFSKKYLKKKDVLSFKKIWELRNKIIHGEYLPSKKEIGEINEMVGLLESFSNTKL